MKGFVRDEMGVNPGEGQGWGERSSVFGYVETLTGD